MAMTQPFYRRLWRTVTVTNPSAGAQWSLAPSGGAIWRVTSLTARLVTDATVASRRVVLRASDGERTWNVSPAPADQTASQTVDYGAHTGSAGINAPGVAQTLGLPSGGVLLTPGHRLTVDVAGMVAGDAWSLIHARVDEILTSKHAVGDSLGPGPEDEQEA